MYIDEEATQKDDQFSNNSSVKNEVPQNNSFSLNEVNDEIELQIKESHVQNNILVVDDQEFNINAAKTIL